MKQGPTIAGSIPYALTSGAFLIPLLRAWRRARDQGIPTMPILSRLLGQSDRTLLSPVIDGFIRAYEAAVGRMIDTGEGEYASDDERRLVALLHREGSDAAPSSSPAAQSLLEVAASCARTMAATTDVAPKSALG